ncbi:hypothetical protein FH972_002465 [Carpinus fangiana]|uniref:Exocyst component Exo84 C-terminal domain-containing protein n=1 Tax=Carpinus fangiana TaxID=176857 RepID=A0A5N6QEY3_9ROSI|nr:hypothetical protein FH972_002465 [Carpinus fangiana]
MATKKPKLFADGGTRRRQRRPNGTFPPTSKFASFPLRRLRSCSFDGKPFSMESSSTLSRFRFRDHRETESSARSDTISDSSSLSSHQDDESEIQTMAGKGIKHLCSELLEIKEASDEDFHRTIFSNYSAFVRILEEVQGVENELMKLKNHVLTQKTHVKELIDGVYLKVLSEETIESIIEDSVFLDPPQPSELEAHIDDVSETLDLFLSENRIDEALVIIEMEDENLKRVQFEGNAPSDMLMSYNSSICEKKAMLTLQLMLMAENPRTTAPELQKALVGLCRLGESQLASQLLLEYYHSRIATGRHNLHCSKSYLQGTYIKELAKFVFSMISQAGRSFVMLYGEASPYASKLIRWACEETKMFVICFNKNLDISVAAIFNQAYSSWCGSGSTGVVNEAYSSIIVGNQPEYCLLTCNGRKFVTLLQAFTEDVSPLVGLQMEDSILSGLMNLFMEYIIILERAIMNLFMEYIIILERAITCEEIVAEKGGSRINLAESLVQQVSILVNLSTLEHFFSSIVRSIFGSISHMNSELMRNHLVGDQQKELDSCMLFIQEASGQLRAHFCQQNIHRMMLLGTGFKHTVKTSSDGQQDSMPSIAFQVNWLMELLRELIEAIFAWISNNKEIWAITEEKTVQPSDNFKKFVLDVQFLVEIASYGGYFSNNPSVLVTSMKSAFLSAGLDPERDIIDSGWAIKAANGAIIKLLGIEKRDVLPNDNPIGILEEKSHENQSEYVSDSLQDDARSYYKDSMESGDDIEGITASEDAVHAERTEFSPLGRLLDLFEEDDGYAYSTAMNSTDSVEIEDIVSKKVVIAAHKRFQIIEKTDLPATLSVDFVGEYSKVRVFTKEGTSRQVHVAESITNELEDGGDLGFSGTEVVAPVENSVKLQAGKLKGMFQFARLSLACPLDLIQNPMVLFAT